MYIFSYTLQGNNMKFFEKTALKSTTIANYAKGRAKQWADLMRANVQVNRRFGQIKEKQVGIFKGDARNDFQRIRNLEINDALKTSKGALREEAADLTGKQIKYFAKKVKAGDVGYTDFRNLIYRR
jgi:hypothetical protein